jgi:hypothetical protein
MFSPGRANSRCPHQGAITNSALEWEPPKHFVNAAGKAEKVVLAYGWALPLATTCFHLNLDARYT